ncbi:hypothetical protein RIF29_28468 [Crotalaria pallida]|uniref:B box-type domain-containing protein n=1 Tax=Crotalaria pallida TaxID=3830 RepID=A0AAN9ED10_CROPI
MKKEEENKIRRRMRNYCELCNNSEASVYCPSDSAFLCSNCDSTVHHANFLVARHLRYSLSSSSKRHRFIHSHLPSSSSSSSSYATSSTKKASDNNTASLITNAASSSNSPSSVVVSNGSAYCSLFAKWSRELELGGVNGNFVSSFASRALNFCLGKWKGLPFRVAAATSFWLGLRFRGLENQNLIMRLELISGVPAKLIVAAHAKLARVFTLHRLQYYHSNSNLQQEAKAEEGWDES